MDLKSYFSNPLDGSVMDIEYSVLFNTREFYELTEKCGEREVARKINRALEYAASLKMPMWFWF